MARQPDGGMYSIKLVHPKHLTYWFFTPAPRGDDRQRWMNFSAQPHARSVADGIPAGHRALVYVTGVQRFIWAIEYTGPVCDGEHVAAGSGLSGEWSKVFLPIRFLATVDAESAPDAQDVLRSAGVDFTPNAYPMKYISAEEYHGIVDAIEWTWPEPQSGPSSVDPAGG